MTQVLVEGQLLPSPLSTQFPEEGGGVSEWTVGPVLPAPWRVETGSPVPMLLALGGRSARRSS